MVDYIDAAQGLAQKREQISLDNIEKEAVKHGDSQKDVEAKKEHAVKAGKQEAMLYSSVAKIMQEQGAKMFENTSVEDIENRVKEGLIKDGTLINKTYNGQEYTEYKDGSSYIKHDSRLYSAATGIAHHSFLSEVEKLPEGQKKEEMQKFYNAGSDRGGAGQALHAVRAVDRLGNNGQTRTKAVQHGEIITVYDPDNKKDGVCQDMKHYGKQPDGAYAEISREDFLAGVKGKQETPVEMKIYNDEPGHFALKTKDGSVHLNANTGKQYSKEQLGQLGTDKALGDYKQAGQQVAQSMAIGGRA